MIITSNSRPVFITGVPRCGSSWVGSVLGSSSSVRYIYEPLNPHWSPAVRGKLWHFKYLTSGADSWPAIEQAAGNAFSGSQSLLQLARAARRGYLSSALRRADRTLVKDPTAVLMTDWVASRYDAQVLVITRHPCGFASSVESLGWKFRVERLLQQDALMNDHLQAHEHTLRATTGDDWQALGAFWAAVHHVLANQAAHREGWIFQRYEDLCREPGDGFDCLARNLGLEMPSSKLERLLRPPGKASADPGSTRKHSAYMADAWKERLSPGQIDAVLGVVKAFGLADPDQR